MIKGEKRVSLSNHLAAEVRFQLYSETETHKWMRYEGDIKKVVG